MGGGPWPVWLGGRAPLGFWRAVAETICDEDILESACRAFSLEPWSCKHKNSEHTHAQGRGERLGWGEGRLPRPPAAAGVDLDIPGKVTRKHTNRPALLLPIHVTCAVQHQVELQNKD